MLSWGKKNYKARTPRLTAVSSLQGRVFDVSL